jgi:hypothetical protein
MRSLALLLASIALGNVVLHDGLVRHERCAEHGELVDVHALTETTAHADIDLAGLHDVPAAEAHEDDHCPLATHPARAHVSAVVLAVDLERASANGARSLASDITSSTRDTWRTPPATGPPVLAA